MGAMSTGARGLAGIFKSCASSPFQRKKLGMYGSMRTLWASTPTSRWFMVVFAPTLMRRMDGHVTPADLHRLAMMGFRVSFRMAS